MKNTTTAPKAEGARAAQANEQMQGSQNPENGKQKVESRNPVAIQFRVPAGEKDFLETLMQFMRSAKRSKDREVANAARRWETAIEFRIRMTMQHRERVANRKVHQGLVRLGEGKQR